MARKAIDLVDTLISHLKSLEITRKKVENFANNGMLVKRDVEKVYEALYLRAFTEFEVLIEKLFIGILTRHVLPPSQHVVPRVEFKSKHVAREVVYRGRNYIDWFPYDRTEQLAKTFFRGGRPFCNLGTTDKQEIDKLLRIRNAIAHKSEHAGQSFINGVIGSIPLIPRERTPASFLRSKVLSLSTPQTRYEHCAISIVSLSRKLCS